MALAAALLLLLLLLLVVLLLAVAAARHHLQCVSANKRQRVGPAATLRHAPVGASGSPQHATAAPAPRRWQAATSSSSSGGAMAAVTAAGPASGGQCRQTLAVDALVVVLPPLQAVTVVTAVRQQRSQSLAPLQHPRLFTVRQQPQQQQRVRRPASHWEGSSSSSSSSRSSCGRAVV
jgi:hypothetical protein